MTPAGTVPGLLGIGGSPTRPTLTGLDSEGHGRPSATTSGLLLLLVGGSPPPEQDTK